jgi:DNA-binding MurR/RpiR family transcriptional regulator
MFAENTYDERRQQFPPNGTATHKTAERTQGMNMNRDWTNAITENAANFTKLEKRIAAYLTANPHALLIDTSSAIAAHLGVSPMTVTRFFKKLGFDSTAAAKRKARRQTYGPDAGPIGRRYERFRASKSPIDGETLFQIGTAAIRRACDMRNQPLWGQIVARVAQADSVYVTGFQTMSYLARGLAMRLSYIRPNVHEIDGSDGVYAKILTDPAPKRVLILIDIFRYARNGPVLAKSACKRGIEVVVFCDEYCDWAAEITPYVVALPSTTTLFFRSDTAIHFSLGLLEQDVIDAYGEKVRQQMALLSDAQELFDQYAK